jgi:hypothetical protein
MTVIHSRQGNKKVIINPTDEPGYTQVEVSYNEVSGVRGLYRTAELRAALGTEQPSCGCDEADENLEAALNRAEKAETDLAELREHDSEVVNDLSRRLGIVDIKLAKAENTLSMIRDEMARLIKEAEWSGNAVRVGAETVIARVVRILELEAEGGFKLPTSTPSKISVRRLPGDIPETLVLWDNGTEQVWRNDSLPYRPDYTPESVLETFNYFEVVE